MIYKNSKQKQLLIRVDEVTYRALQAHADQMGQTVSSVVREAIAEHLSLSQTKLIAAELQSALKKITEQVIVFENSLPEITGSLKSIVRSLSEIRVELESLRTAVSTVAFFSALMVELFKTRIFQKATGLKDEEYERFKKAWELSHERADLRVESLLGERIWKRKFNPLVDPLKK